MSNHPYIGFLKQGDIIRPVDRPQDAMVIKSICVDPTRADGSVLIYLWRVDTGKDVCVGPANLNSWFEETTWERVNQP